MFWIVVCVEDKIWMTVQHNNTELTRVQGSSPENPYSMTLNYGGSMEQLEALIDGSEYCEQEVIYHCRRSRLLNTPGKVLSFFMVWWNIPIFCLFFFFFLTEARIIGEVATSIKDMFTNGNFLNDWYEKPSQLYVVLLDRLSWSI